MEARADRSEVTGMLGILSSSALSLLFAKRQCFPNAFQVLRVFLGKLRNEVSDC